MSSFTIDTWHVGYGTMQTNGGDAVTMGIILWLAACLINLAIIYPKNKMFAGVILLGMTIAIPAMGLETAYTIPSMLVGIAVSAFIMFEGFNPGGSSGRGGFSRFR